MLLIKNGLYFDGLGSKPVKKHLSIKNGKLASVDELLPDENSYEKVIDAQDKWVTPGFVDTHTHYDAEILVAPGLKESVRHGVTTIIIGSCSLGTVHSSPEDCSDFFARVEALPDDVVLSILKKYKTWNNAKDYISELQKRPLGPNVAFYLGHSDLRTSVMGLKRATDEKEKPTEEEMEKMEALLEEALDKGFLGLSVMTNPWDKVGGSRFRSARLPSTYATWKEYRRFNKILRRRGRILQGAPNITTKYNMFLFMAASIGGFFRKPLKTTLITAADTKANPTVATLTTTAASLTNMLGGNMKWQSIPSKFELYADGMDIVLFEEFGAGEAALHLADALERNELLKQESYRRWFRKDYEKKWTPRVWHRDFGDAQIVNAPDTSLIGKSFGDVAAARSLHPVDAFLDLVVEFGNKLRWKTTVANHRIKSLQKILCNPHVQISFADSGAHIRNMAFYNFPLCFLKVVQDAQIEGAPIMSTEKAVAKVTGDLGEWYGIDAGRLRVGDRADIAIIDPKKLDHSLEAYHEAPIEEMEGLVRMVRRNDKTVLTTLINGEVVFENGKFKEDFGATKRYGSFLSYQADS